MSERSFDRLPEDVQQAVQDAGKAAIAAQREAVGAAVVAAVFALVLGFGVYCELNFRNIVPVTLGSLKTMTIVMFIIALANGFGWVMAFERVPGQVTQALESFTDTPVLCLLMINLLLLVIGCVMDRRRISMTVAGWFEIPDIVAQSDLIAIAPRRLFSLDPRLGKLRAVPLPLEEVVFSFDVCCDLRTEREPGQKWLRRVVSNVFKEVGA